MSFNQRVKVSLLPVEELHERLPRALDNLQITVSLHLPYEMYHLGVDDANLVPLVFQFCNST